MKNHLFLISIFLSVWCYAQPNGNIYYEKIELGYNIYADNNEYCPISTQIDFKLTNVKPQDSTDGYFIIPPKSKKVLLATLKIIERGKPYGLSYEYAVNYGNIKQTTFDSDFAYYLPFHKNNSYLLAQGYNGTASHGNLNALDFTMPIGTEITAIRAGIVIKIIEHNNKNCTQSECKKLNNLVIICHNDGTFSEYDHIKQNGATIEVGDKIDKGQLIAYSGNVGWSTGPHLHLMVYLQRLDTIETIATKFLVEDKSTPILLIPKTKYQRNY